MAEYMLLQRQLRWIGHVIRMSSNRLPRLLLNGQRMPGGPKLRYKDHVRRILNKSNIQVSDQAAADRRSRRHHRRNPTATGPRYLQCSRVCASEFGLRSHLRNHISRPSQRS